MLDCELQSFSCISQSVSSISGGIVSLIIKVNRKKPNPISKNMVKYPKKKYSIDPTTGPRPLPIFEAPS